MINHEQENIVSLVENITNALKSNGLHLRHYERAIIHTEIEKVLSVVVAEHLQFPFHKANDKEIKDHLKAQISISMESSGVDFYKFTSERDMRYSLEKVYQCNAKLLLMRWL